MGSDADLWVRRYFERADSIGVPALDPVMQVGRVYESSCVFCEWKLRDTVTITRGGCVEVCASCRRPWKYEDQLQLRGSFQVSRRPGSAERFLSPWCDVGRVLSQLYDHRRHRWAVRIYLASVIGQQTLREIAEAAAVRYRRAPWLWNRDRVAELIREGRRVVTLRFVEAEIIRDGGRAWQKLAS